MIEQVSIECKNQYPIILYRNTQIVGKILEKKDEKKSKKIKDKKQENIDDLNDDKIVKPFLKWVGGKTQILTCLIGHFPLEINNYHEIFLGGGSVLLALLYFIKKGNILVKGKIYAYDANESLICLYKDIQSNHESLYETLKIIIKEYEECKECHGVKNRKPKDIIQAKKSKESYYYWIRSEYNKLVKANENSLEKSAMFIFLNKTCWRGVFRIGPNGFNVPYGNYESPEIVNKEHLEKISILIKDVIFQCCDYKESMLNITEKCDFAYLDPPYASENDKGFVKYTENGFSLENHLNLFKLCNNLTIENKNFMLSNADVKIVRENFTNEKYEIIPILCKRSINSKNPESKAKEVLIKNY